MRHVLILAAFIAALALPLLAPAPVSVGPLFSECPAGYGNPFPIAFLQDVGIPPGKARQAAAQDVNHNGLVCVKERGAKQHGETYRDDIIPLDS